MEFKTYNKKAFLLPDSINSMAAYHAKLFPDGRYMFRIHDCNTGIRLIGELKKEQDLIDAANKLNELAAAAARFANHFERLRDEIYPKKNDNERDFSQGEENARAAKEVLQVS